MSDDKTEKEDLGPEPEADSIAGYLKAIEEADKAKELPKPDKAKELPKSAIAKQAIQERKERVIISKAERTLETHGLVKEGKGRFSFPPPKHSAAETFQRSGKEYPDAESFLRQGANWEEKDTFAKSLKRDGPQLLGIGAIVLIILFFIGLFGDWNKKSIATKKKQQIEEGDGRKKLWRNREIISVEKITTPRKVNRVFGITGGRKPRPLIGQSTQSGKTEYRVTYEAPNGVLRTQTYSYDPTWYQE